MTRYFITAISSTLFFFTNFSQNCFDHYYRTGYFNAWSSNVFTTSDSGCVVLNYIQDSIHGRQDFGLLRLDKQGNELVRKSFNLFGLDYLRPWVPNHFIKATPCSYFLTGVQFPGSNYTDIIFNKINKQSLDTMLTAIYQDTSSVTSIYMNNLIKLSANKYLLVGNKSTTSSQWPFMFQLDSVFQVSNETNIYNPNLFTTESAKFNPSNKLILLSGSNSIAGMGNHQPFTLMHMDTLGNPVNAITALPSSFYCYFAQFAYSPFDNTYVGVGNKPTSVLGGGSSPYLLGRLMISKFDAVTLAPLWQYTYGDEAYGNGLSDVKIMPDGSIITSGSYSPLTSLPLMNMDYGGSILKVDKDGNPKWFSLYNHFVTGVDTSYYTETFNGIDTTLEGGYVVCGSVLSQPKDKAWVVKTDSLGCTTSGCTTYTVDRQNFSYSTHTVNVTPPPPSTYTAVKDNDEANSVQIYPNPASDVVIVNSNSKNTVVELVICDLLGQELKRLIMKQSAVIDLRDVSPGVYMLNLISNGRTVKSTKLVKE